ncbi:hypothetical protein DRO91_08765 [Candidatus Heimdallarchaeota archaeon]|nr:MAG: hypothetical protein DRO91_08765 [Candidatus Heimdallarchaeota archaeon]
MTYTTKDIVEILGIAESTLRNWIGEGYVDCSYATKDKRKKRVFSYEQAQLIIEFNGFVKMGFKRAIAAKCAKRRFYFANLFNIRENHVTLMTKRLQEKGEVVK